MLSAKHCAHTDDPDEDGDDGEIEVEELVYNGKTFNVSLAYSPLHKDTDSVIWGQVRGGMIDNQMFQ